MKLLHQVYPQHPAQSALPEAMYIKEVSIDGFKSYAQRVTLSNFDPGFNAITGLNGSGKSNILDSLCFVMGIKNLSAVSGLLGQIRQNIACITAAACSMQFWAAGEGPKPARACIQAGQRRHHQGNCQHCVPQR